VSALELRAVSDPIALREVSFSVAPGERFALLGPSGAGKTTLLRVIAGLGMHSGDIYLGGRNISRLPAHTRRVALCSQHAGLFPHLSLFENLAFPLYVRKHDSVPRERIRKTAACFGLENFLERPARELSAGEAQRGALARALLSSPDALLLDEPVAHLDPPLRIAVRDDIVRAASGSAAMLYVTHDHEDAFAVAQRIGILIRGRLVQCGTPQEIYDRPVSVDVARFVGPLPMNILPAVDGQSRPGILYGIRGEQIQLGSSDSDARGIVTASRFVGGSTILHVECDSGMIRVALPAGSSVPASGERVGLRFRTGALQCFDAKTGERIACP